MNFRNENLTFGQAIELVKEGKLISRKGWNGRNMFIFMRPADYLSVNMIVHQVKSLPQAVKNYFARKTDPDAPDRLDGESKIWFTPYLCMKAADGSIVNGWLASQTDMLSNDWMETDVNEILELEHWPVYPVDVDDRGTMA
jgi:hypothetical protein